MKFSYLWRANWMYLLLLLFHIVFLFVIDGLVLSGSDEALYLGTFENLVNSEKSKIALNGWSFENQFLIASVLIPAQIFHGFGVDSLLSLRLNSLVYLAGTLMVLDRVFVEIFRSQVKKQFYVLLLFIMPSVFFFGSLGGRETLVGFYLVLCVYLSRQYVMNRHFSTLTCFCLASVGLFVSKPHYLMVLFISLLLIALVGSQEVLDFRKSIINLIVGILLVGTCLPGSLQHNIRSVQSLSGLTNLSEGIQDSPSEGIQDSPSDGIQDSPSDGIQDKNPQHSNLYELKELIRKNSWAATFFSATGITSKIDSKISQGFNAEQSKSRAQKSELGSRIGSNPRVIIQSFFLFLLKPIPFTENGSFLLNFFSIEFPIWLILYWMMFVEIYRTRRKGSIFSYRLLLPITALTTLSLITFLADTNIQVALRHRYPIGLLILLVIGFARPKIGKFPDNQ